MTSDDPKEVHLRLVDEVLLRGQYDVLDELFAPQHDLRQNVLDGIDRTGPAALRLMLKLAKSGLKDWAFEVRDQVAEGNRVATIFSGSAFHYGTLGVFVASNRTLHFTGLLETRFEDGKAAESWLEVDTLSLYRQAGLARIEKLKEDLTF